MKLISALAAAMALSATPTFAGQWVYCTLNTQTGTREAYEGVDVIDLGKQVPFRHRPDFRANPKYTLEPYAQRGECFVNY